MDPYNQAYLPKLSRGQRQDMTCLDSNTTPNPTLPDSVLFDSQSLPLRAFGTHGQIISQSVTAAHDNDASSQFDLAEDLTPRPLQIKNCAVPSLQQRLGELTVQDPFGTSQALNAYEQDADAVANPKNMPIGSLADLKKLPEWGVVKISNIPYAITKQEITQFLGRQARLITTEQGCPIHIIMDRSTAKTMDCYVELLTHKEAQDTVTRINRLFETGRAPRLGNRHVDVELSDQDKLLKDLFPRAKCIDWQDGMPYRLPNKDRWCSGFAGFCTNEEITLAIRHAEQPNRCNFGEKCPQRTYESFPWYATTLYSVHDRNQLFDLANRHILALSLRIRTENTVGLDQKLLHDLIQAGLKCPAFNERQKYTLVTNSDIPSEISKLSALSKWFPFDTLARKPDTAEEINMCYARYISQGTTVSSSSRLVSPQPGDLGLSNTYPQDQPSIRSPYGRIWFEWSEPASNITWEAAVRHEMVILSTLVFNGWLWINDDMDRVLGSRRTSGGSSFSFVPCNRRHLSLDLSLRGIEQSQASTESSFSGDGSLPSVRRASESAGSSKKVISDDDSGPWGRKVLLDLPARATPAHRGHRITQSSPMCLPSPTTNPWKDMNFG
ncbi:hypothetical protein BDV18DRAFT_160698 [Aspergillus unguis]